MGEKFPFTVKKTLSVAMTIFLEHTTQWHHPIMGITLSTCVFNVLQRLVKVLSEVGHKKRKYQDYSFDIPWVLR